MALGIGPTNIVKQEQLRFQYAENEFQPPKDVALEIWFSILDKLISSGISPLELKGIGRVTKYFYHVIHEAQISPKLWSLLFQKNILNRKVELSWEDPKKLCLIDHNIRKGMYLHRTLGVPGFSLHSQNTLKKSIEEDRETFENPQHKNNINNICIADRYVVSISTDAKIKMWDLKTTQYLQDLTPENQAALTSLFSISFFGNKLYAYDYTGNVYLWSLTNDGFKWEASLPAHRDIIHGFLEWENAFITYSKDNSIKIWDKENKRCTKELSVPSGNVTQVIEKKGFLFSCSENGEINVFDLKNQACVKTISDLKTKMICASDTHLYCGTGEGGLFVYEMGDYSVKGAMAYFNTFEVISHLQIVNDKLICGTEMGDIRVYDAKTCKYLGKMETYVPMCRVTGFFVENGLLFAGYEDGTINIFSLETFNRILSLKQHEKKISCLVFYEGKLYSGSSDEIKMWDFTLVQQDFDKIIKESEESNVAPISQQPLNGFDTIIETSQDASFLHQPLKKQKKSGSLKLTNTL